jgi:hypothetical protein
MARDGTRNIVEGIAELADLARRRLQGWQLQRPVARAIGGDDSLDDPKRLQQLAVHDPPADGSGGDPHHHRKKDQQNVDRSDRNGAEPDSQLQDIIGDRRDVADRLYEGHGLIIVAQQHAAPATGQLEIEVGACSRDEGELAQGLAAIFGDRLDRLPLRKQGESQRVAVRAYLERLARRIDTRTERGREAARGATQRPVRSIERIAARLHLESCQPGEHTLADRAVGRRRSDGGAGRAHRPHAAGEQFVEALGFVLETGKRLLRALGAVFASAIDRREDRDDAEGQQAEAEDKQHLRPG